MAKEVFITNYKKMFKKTIHYFTVNIFTDGVKTGIQESSVTQIYVFGILVYIKIIPNN